MSFKSIEDMFTSPFTKVEELEEAIKDNVKTFLDTAPQPSCARWWDSDNSPGSGRWWDENNTPLRKHQQFKQRFILNSDDVLARQSYIDSLLFRIKSLEKLLSDADDEIKRLKEK